MTTPIYPRRWSNDLQAVFNFYSENPQRIPAVPDPSRMLANVPVVRPYSVGIQEIQDSDLFLEGMLLRSLECEARYPYVHYIVYNNQSAHVQGEHPLFQKEALRNITTSHATYSEMNTFVDHHTPLLPKRPQGSQAAYIITSFKTLGCVRELDKNWSYWSGADLIVETIPPLLKLQRLTFHKIKPEGSCSNNPFVYILICELGDALTHKNRALEFVETLKDRQCGLSCLYGIEHVF